MDLSNLAASIVSRRCALFAGAGLTADSGGALWSELVDYLKDKFDYDSPLHDEFEIMGDISEKVGRSVVYNAIIERLKDAKISDSLTALISLPWFTAFTTNYDVALEDALNRKQKLNVRTICTGREYALTGLQSEILCVKLMGSLDIRDGDPGSMILDPGDLAIAREERARIFDTLASHAANRSFLFIGYSFNDKLFFEMLQKIIKTIGKPTNTYYAVFLNEPDEEKEYLLKQYNVEVIVSDLLSFTKELASQVALREPTDYTSKRIPLDRDIISIDSTKVGDFLTLYEPILLEDLEEEVSPQSFLKGQTSSLKPFDLKWHFPREAIKSIIDTAKANDKRIIAVEGELGSGRTFVILAAIYDLITKYRSLAIRIPSYSINKIPAPEHLKIFLQEVERAASSIGVKYPERIVIWAEFPLESSEIAQFSALVSEFEKYPIVLIAENYQFSHIAEGWFSSDKSHTIILDASLKDTEKDQLVEYIVETCRVHRFPEISEEEARQIADEEESFLSIMYRSLDPTRRSINRIIQEEFSNLTELPTKKCISLCAIASSVDIQMPVAILRKALSKSIERELTFPDTFEIAIEKAKAFTKQSIDHRTNPYFSIYNTLIAQHLITLIGLDLVHELLEAIAQTADLRSRIEAEFISNLLIYKGVNWKGPQHLRPFKNVGLEKALTELMVRQPARPIIHHLARLYFNIDQDDVRIVQLLEKALAEPKEYYILEERKENVLVTLARVKWAKNKEELLSCARNDPEIEKIISLLIQARSGFFPNIHAYDLHARILKELSQEKSEEEKLNLLSEAIDILRRGLEQCSEDDPNYQRLKELKTKILADIDPVKAEEFAKELLIERKDGTGYYILAVKEYYQNLRQDKAIDFLDKAIGAEKCPGDAIVLKIEIMLSKKAPEYVSLLELVEQLSAIGYADSWKSAYYKGIVYTIVGKYSEAVYYFKISHRLAPRYLQRKIQVFWEDKKHRKVHTGKIGRILTEREGRIYAHGIEGWKDDIYFDPRKQEKKEDLKPGLPVNFELGFSHRGPIAFDVRPYKPS